MKNFGKFSLLCGAVLALGACGQDKLHAPSSLLQDKRLQIEEEMFSENVALSEVDDLYLKALSHHYMRHGGSILDVVVTYDPKSYRNTAMMGGTRAGDISDGLRKRGVRDIEVSILPIKGQGDEGRLIVSYMSHSAKGPKGCDQMMPGMNEDEFRDNVDYKMGCSIHSMIARQVSRPSDLLGRGRVDGVTDGRTAANIVELYRTGAPNEPLDGETASEDN